MSKEQEILALLEALCAKPGVSGWEDDVRAYLQEQLSPYVDEMRVDPMGNLIVFKRGEKRCEQSVLLAAHMDEVGMIVRHITEDGYLKFDFVGGVDRRVVLGRKVLVGPKGIPGIIGLKATHLTEKDARTAIPKTEALYLDIGAKTRAEAEGMVSLGHRVAFPPDWALYGDGFLRAKAIDDRIGCAVLCKLFQEPLPIDCTAAFTVQEEVGTRGAFSAAFSAKPDVALVVEGTTAADLPGVSPDKQVCAPGRGVVIPFMDGGAIYDRDLFALLTKVAEEKKIPWQTKEYISGGTDARTIQRSRAGVQTAGIAAAVRYLHGPSSVAATADFDGLYQLAYGFLEALGNRRL